MCRIPLIATVVKTPSAGDFLMRDDIAGVTPRVTDICEELMKLPHRRQFMHLAAGAAALPFAPQIARAQGYPTRPVRIMVGQAAGSGSDTVARLIGQFLSERLGQQFVVENRQGAGGNIAAEAVVRAPADGYTLLVIGANKLAHRAGQEGVYS